jgi:RNA polymerase sigma factor (sigma-70 family)
MTVKSERTGATLDQIERVYRTRRRELLRLAQAVVGSKEAAKDVVHDAFVSVVEQRASFAARGSLDGWIWRSVLNKARDHRRRRDVITMGPPRQAETGLDRAAVRAAVAALPERQRHVLFLHYFGDLDYRTIGEVLDIRAGTVAATLNAARAALRDHLDDGWKETHDARHAV